jgi:hypothetical protein
VRLRRARPRPAFRRQRRAAGSVGPVSVAIIVFVLVVVIPVGFLVTMSGVAGLLGWLLKDQVDDAYEGSEVLALSDAN